jgi:hypothetical protein
MRGYAGVNNHGTYIGAGQSIGGGGGGGGEGCGCLVFLIGCVVGLFIFVPWLGLAVAALAVVGLVSWVIVAAAERSQRPPREEEDEDWMKVW